MTAKDAYKASYETSATEQVIYNEATKLLKNEAVAKKIEELRKPLEDHVQTVAISDREKKRTILWDMIENPDIGYSDRLRAMDILNKMDSEYININKTIEEKTEISNLDTDTLIKLVRPA